MLGTNFENKVDLVVRRSFIYQSEKFSYKLNNQALKYR